MTAGAHANDGRLADNIVFFARALRRTGLRIGPAAIADAIGAVKLIGIGSRGEFYAALQCTFVKRHEDQAVFDEAFRLFWRSPDLVNKMIALMSPIAMPRSGEDRRRRAGQNLAQRPRRDVGAEGVEVSVGQVDDPHHAIDEAQPTGDEEQRRRRQERIEEMNEEEIHQSATR